MKVTLNSVPREDNFLPTHTCVHGLTDLCSRTGSTWQLELGRSSGTPEPRWRRNRRRLTPACNLPRDRVGEGPGHPGACHRQLFLPLTIQNISHSPVAPNTRPRITAQGQGRRAFSRDSCSFLRRGLSNEPDTQTARSPCQWEYGHSRRKLSKQSSYLQGHLARPPGPAEIWGLLNGLNRSGPEQGETFVNKIIRPTSQSPGCGQEAEGGKGALQCVQAQTNLGRKAGEAL